MTNTETDRLYASISAAASGFKVAMTPEEVAELAVRNDFGDDC